MTSTCLFIFVDGTYLKETDTQKMVRNVKNQCSSNINRFISQYKRENGKLPPIVIVVTKYDRCMQYAGEEIIVKVIKKAFSSLFTSDESTNSVAMIPVSIGRNIEDENYSGNLEPINIYKPLFFGIFEPLKAELRECKQTISILRGQYEQERRTCDCLEDALKEWCLMASVHKKKRQEFDEEQKRHKESLAKLQYYENELSKLEDEKSRRIKYLKKVRKELCGVPVFIKDTEYRIAEGEDYDSWE